ATMQPLLRPPRAGNHVHGRSALARAQRGTDERMMTIVPGRFDEDATQMAVTGFGDAALGAFGAARMLGGYEPDERHRAWDRDGAGISRGDAARAGDRRGCLRDTVADHEPLLPARWECESRSARRRDRARRAGRHRGGRF